MHAAALTQEAQMQGVRTGDGGGEEDGGEGVGVDVAGARQHVVAGAHHEGPLLHAWTTNRHELILRQHYGSMIAAHSPMAGAHCIVETSARNAKPQRRAVLPLRAPGFFRMLCSDSSVCFSTCSGQMSTCMRCTTGVPTGIWAVAATPLAEAPADAVTVCGHTAGNVCSRVGPA